jgi:hypothetical protein
MIFMDQLKQKTFPMLRSVSRMIYDIVYQVLTTRFTLYN